MKDAKIGFSIPFAGFGPSTNRELDSEPTNLMNNRRFFTEPT